MDKTININLGGTLFSIDEEAYRILRDYLQTIDNKFRNVAGGAETIEDIESRIAEIFISKKGLTGVINRENVEEVISIIGKPEDFGQSDASYSPGEFTTSRKRMFRNPDDTIIGGVCGGIGTYLNTDPVWIRILFILFTLMFGLGLFVYLALWIALPAAVNEVQRKEMYGATEYRNRIQVNDPDYRTGQTKSSVGNAFNEMFKAIGRVCHITVRIFLIICGVILVFTGFVALVAFVMIFLLQIPGAFSSDIDGITISYLPDFLNYIITPAVVPWIKTLISILVIIPLLALIYGGIRLIFWFRVRDGFVWLGGFILWVIAAAALTVILFNEGVGFADSARTEIQQEYNIKSDTIYVIAGKTIDELKYDNSILIPDNDYSVYISQDKRDIYFHSRINILPTEDKNMTVDIRKRSSGRSRNEALHKAESLIYNYRFSADTLCLDEYASIPDGSKWSFDNVSVSVNIPLGKIVYLDNEIDDQFFRIHDHEFPSPVRRFYIMTEDGLQYIDPEKDKD